jgi:hypothetical protein
MLRSNRFVLATALAMLAIGLPSAGQARQKIPAKMDNCRTPSGTILQNGENLIVIDDETCATAYYGCAYGVLCSYVKWDAQCGDQDFGAPQQTPTECVYTPAPSLALTPVTPSATFTLPTTSTLPSTNLSPRGTSTPTTLPSTNLGFY